MRCHELFAAGLVVSLTCAPLAAREPSAPGDEHAKASGHPAPAPIAADEVERAVRAGIDARSKAPGGAFKVVDEVLVRKWELTLVKVDGDKLMRLDADRYVVCVDMKDPVDTLVDVDFFLGEHDGKLEVSDTVTHKVDGKPRYNWRKKGAYWARAELDAAAKKP